MNLGMSGAIGGFGQGLAQAAQMSNANQMEAYKLQVEEDMRERIADRMADRGARTLAAKQQWNANTATKIQNEIQGQNAQSDANTINVNNPESQVSPLDVSTANAGAPLNPAQREAYNMPERSPLDESRQMVMASLKYGDPELTKGFENLQQSDIANKNADANIQYKQDIIPIKQQMADIQKNIKEYGKDRVPPADQVLYGLWVDSKKAKGITDPAKLGYDDYINFKTHADAQTRKDAIKWAGTVPINTAPMPGSEEDSTGTPISASDWLKQNQGK